MSRIARQARDCREMSLIFLTTHAYRAGTAFLLFVYNLISKVHFNIETQANIIPLEYFLKRLALYIKCFSFSITVVTKDVTRTDRALCSNLYKLSIFKCAKLANFLVNTLRQIVVLDVDGIDK